MCSLNKNNVLHALKRFFKIVKIITVKLKSFMRYRSLRSHRIVLESEGQYIP